ncbi:MULTISPECIES: DUF2254 domain-containing protein [Rhodopseudomonas]|uniref:Formate C-acetyltransferase glycine radical n=1 Tax=Rhodopseudomonas palustris TaxID=1076 RepID=A0A0D7F065_RHOPL|nr:MULTISPECIES: DUF2254 domain-containing protein [Rhodopseudomonas]KIZ45102.1 formate C-acetyltransferase glycine radical [Rhodopseudomonas palustris]WOK17752.1 DUF2254 domain-containing protein [Rhodopseudomonas sp. BAL398]
MTARLRKFLSDLAETFWLVPALLVLAGIVAALGLIHVDRVGVVPTVLLENWLYNGGATGARTLLGAVASSTIGVAGTVFSITIAALSLAAGQMGPRLLRNFTHDRGNQLTLGIFLGTFCYTLVVLRSVRTPDEGAFIPHLALGVGIALAFVCVGTLVYFVGHIASRINVDTVVGLVSEDVQEAMGWLTTDERQPEPPPLSFWRDAEPIHDSRQGYLQQLDEEGLATWATENNTAIHLLVRPGDYVFPGAPIAVIKPPCEGADQAVRNATALGPQRVSSTDLRFAIRQLVEVAVRALSPGINDPHTAISVMDRLGTALCEMAKLYLPTGVTKAEGRPVLVVPHIQYEELVDAMFHMIRQNAAGQPVVLIQLLEVLTQVVSVERKPDRMALVRKHADLVLRDAERDIATASDLSDLRRRHRAFVTMLQHGPMGQFDAQS